MFTPIKNTKVYQQVIEQIKNMILNGELKKGDKLPSERELSNTLKVSRTSVREALRAMEIIGLIECKQGEGNFIKNSYENNLIEPLSIMFILNGNNLNDIFELRKSLEIEVAAIASLKITSEELENLRNNVNKMKFCENETIRVKLDHEFHYIIAKASKNILIINILNASQILMDNFIKNARKEILKNTKNLTVIQVQHELIYKSMLEHNSKKSSESMKQHMELIRKYLNI